LQSIPRAFWVRCAQTVPHVPQLFVSLVVSTQIPLQLVRPLHVEAQALPLQNSVPPIGGAGQGVLQAVPQ